MSWYELIEVCGADTIVRRFKTKISANEYYDK